MVSTRLSLAAETRLMATGLSMLSDLPTVTRRLPAGCERRSPKPAAPSRIQLAARPRQQRLTRCMPESSAGTVHGFRPGLGLMLVICYPETGSQNGDPGPKE